MSSLSAGAKTIASVITALAIPMAALASAPVSRAFTTQARLPARLHKAQRVAVRASADSNAVKEAVIKATAFGSLAGSFLAAGNAQAAMEVANIAASDNRFGVIASLAIPVLGWVGFNIFQPFLNQLADIESKKGRAVAVGLGLSAAALLAAGSADAATEVSQLAASDNRFGVIALLFVPVLGWVGFNILQPFLNQLADIEARKGKAVAAGLGLGAASLLAASSADASEVMQLAASDNRFGVIALLFVPVLGWVGFNILQPFLNQLADLEARKGKAVAAGLGLGAASLLAASSADASEVMQLAASDNRFGVIALLFVPVLGWVGFNILQPFLNQLADLEARKGKAVAAGLGLGAASLLAASSADAAEVMQLAASDNRFGVIASLAIPVLGWVGFNIFQPFLNQLDAMKKD